jgi:hypothetical protein
VAVSTVIRPVTQAADVAVKSAVSRGAGLPVVVAHGSDSSEVPIRTVTRNAKGTIRAG